MTNNSGQTVMHLHDPQVNVAANMIAVSDLPSPSLHFWMLSFMLRSESIMVVALFSSVHFYFHQNSKSNNTKIVKNHKHKMEEMQRKAKAWYLLQPLKKK